MRTLGVILALVLIGTVLIAAVNQDSKHRHVWGETTKGQMIEGSGDYYKTVPVVIRGCDGCDWMLVKRGDKE